MSKNNRTRPCAYCLEPASKKKRLRVFEQPIHINCLRYCILISEDSAHRRLLLEALTKSRKTIEKSGKHVSPRFVFYKVSEAPYDLNVPLKDVRYGKFEEQEDLDG